GPFAFQDAVRLDTPICAPRETLAPALPEQVSISELGDPQLPLGGAACAPWLEARLSHGDGHFTHLFAASATMLDGPLEHVRRLALPVDAWKGFAQRSEHGVFDPVVPGCCQAFDEHRLEAFDHHASAHLGCAGNAELVACHACSKPQAFEHG